MSGLGALGGRNETPVGDSARKIRRNCPENLLANWPFLFGQARRGAPLCAAPDRVKHRGPDETLEER